MTAPNAGFSALYSHNKVGREIEKNSISSEHAESEVKPSFRRLFGHDLTVSGRYEICNKSVQVIKGENISPTYDKDNFKEQSVRLCPYSPTPCYTQFTVTPRLKVFHYDVS